MKRWSPPIRSGLVVFMFGASGVALAYVPPSEYIVKQIVKKREGLKSARLRSTVTLYEGDRLGSVHFRQTSWYLPAQGVLRTWITDDQDRKLYVSERTTRSWGPVASLLLESQLTELTKSLRARKIPIVTEEELLRLDTEEQRRDAEYASIQRLSARPAWLIGRSVGQGPQLWIDKDTFLPLRVVFDRAIDNDTFDITFEGSRAQKDLPFPRALVVSKGSGRTFFREEFLEVSPNLDEKSLKLAAQSGPTGFTDAGNTIPSEMRNLILQYVETVH